MHEHTVHSLHIAAHFYLYILTTYTRVSTSNITLDIFEVCEILSVFFHNSFFFIHFFSNDKEITFRLKTVGVCVIKAVTAAAIAVVFVVAMYYHCQDVAASAIDVAKLIRNCVLTNFYCFKRFD